MILYTNGCSHTAGHCLDTIKTYPYIVAASIFGKSNYETIDYVDINSDLNVFSYKNHIFDKIKKNKNYLIFQPDSGKSNDLIFFESYNFLNEAVKNNIKVDFSIIQWSGANRTIFVEPNGFLDNINPHDNPEKGLKFEPFASSQTVHYMKILQDFFQLNKINYCYIPYMEIDKKVYDDFHLVEALNLKKITENISVGHRNYFRKRGWVCDEHGHPSDYANYYLAIECLKILDNTIEVVGLFNFYDAYDVDYNWRYDGPKIEFIKKNYNKLGDATNYIIAKLKKLF